VKTIVLVKQVPRPDAIEFDDETKSLRREGVPLVLNPFDAEAVATAARLGGEVVAMTMGPPQATEALRLCLALGADRAVHLSDRTFAVADTLGTSRTLALAIRKEGADLVLCGRKTVDSETWQVPPEVAAFLGWPQLTSVVELSAGDGTLRAVRETDAGYDTFELAPPAVLSLARAGAAPAEGRDGPIDVWAARDLVDDLAENDKRFGQTGSPTRVLAVRDVTPERARETLPDADAAARRVAELLEERRPEPPAWDKPERLGERPGKSYDAWTLVELADGLPTRASLELVGKGRELAGKLGGANVALVLGADVGAAPAALARAGAERVVVVEDARLDAYVPDLWSAALVEVIRRCRPHALAIPASANGRDLGPRAAGELELGMTGDCVNLGVDRAGRLIQTKPAYGGNIVSIIMGATTPQLATVRPRVFEPLEPRDAEAVVERLELGPLPEPSARLVGRRAEPAFDLDAADVVVLLGPGAPAGLDAGAAVVGGTREVCAAGRLPWNRHVGLFGRAVAPDVLVAVGVPGDFEHLAGFVKAGVVVSLDGGEGLRERADVILDGDAAAAVPRLLGGG
jgi:electron transfer flavoprotein alpha/beta subunit